LNGHFFYPGIARVIGPSEANPLLLVSQRLYRGRRVLTVEKEGMGFYSQSIAKGECT
jgi:hypothetical protein